MSQRYIHPAKWNSSSSIKPTRITQTHASKCPIYHSCTSYGYLPTPLVSSDTPTCFWTQSGSSIVATRLRQKGPDGELPSISSIRTAAQTIFTGQGSFGRDRERREEVARLLEEARKACEEQRIALIRADADRSLRARKTCIEPRFQPRVYQGQCEADGVVVVRIVKPASKHPQQEEGNARWLTQSFARDGTVEPRQTF